LAWAMQVGEKEEGRKKEKKKKKEWICFSLKVFKIMDEVVVRLVGLILLAVYFTNNATLETPWHSILPTIIILSCVGEGKLGFMIEDLFGSYDRFNTL
jgi:hypothetical protein